MYYGIHTNRTYPARRIKSPYVVLTHNGLLFIQLYVTRESMRSILSIIHDKRKYAKHTFNCMEKQSQ